MPNQKQRVLLSADQRRELEVLCRKQSVGAAKARRARVLLMADENHPDGRRRDWEISEAVGISPRQVVRIRQKFVQSGELNLDRKPRIGTPRVLCGDEEAQLVTLCCSEPPDGRDRWTLQLLCDELVRLQVVESVSPETVRRRLKKML